MRYQSNGVVLWEGASLIDGQPIVAVLTGLQRPSSNRKTGDMLQAWILPQGSAPVASVKDGSVRSVCGDCPLLGACYVNIGHAPTAVYTAWRRSSYPRWQRRIMPLPKRPVRLGAWGDPAAVPLVVWRRVLENSGAGHTGYTHQWREKAKQRYRELLMASCETERDVQRARSLGWRAFRVTAKGAGLRKGEVWCPSSRGVNCADCRLCDGWRGGDRAVDYRPSIAIEVHGSRAGNFGAVLARS